MKRETPFIYKSLKLSFPGFTLVTIIFFVFCAAQSQATTTGFINNPTTNSTDFNAYVTAQGATINTNVNFDTASTGTLNPAFYTISDGVTIVASSPGFNDQIVNGNGPGQSGQLPPTSPGEGLHPVSNFLFVATPDFGHGPNTLTFNFTNPVESFGFFTIDLFGATEGTAFTNTITLTAFSGLDGAGTNLGSFSPANYNFQPDNLYFMGLASDVGNEIGSVVFNRAFDDSGDNIGLDNIRFGIVSSVPDSGSTFMLMLGSVAMLFALRHTFMREPVAH